MNTSFLHRENSVALQNLAGERESILRTLAYFDVFHYPLTEEEITRFMNGNSSTQSVKKLLQRMTDQETIYSQYGLYSLQNNPLLFLRRRKGNERAGKLLKKAHRIGRFLYRFPFVKAIGISGSLSKDFADERSDIDFFIITGRERLWIARTCMHLFKKLTYLTGRQHYYCMNYYVDEKALQLNDRNVYTAIELKTLLPVCGFTSMQEFFLINKWADEWFPNYSWRQQQQKDPSGLILKRLMEWMLNNRFGNWMDVRLQHITSRRWQRKLEKRHSKASVLLVTDRHYCYSNAGSLREKILDKYAKKLEELGINNE